MVNHTLEELHQSLGESKTARKLMVSCSELLFSSSSRGKSSCGENVHSECGSTFKVSRLASGNKRTSRFKACSCCFFVGSSVNTNTGTRTHTHTHAHTKKCLVQSFSGYLSHNVAVKLLLASRKRGNEQVVYTLLTAMNALRYSTVSNGWGNSLMNSFKRLAASCCFSCCHGNIPS